jgi:hypothetical protein
VVVVPSSSETTVPALVANTANLTGLTSTIATTALVGAADNFTFSGSTITSYSLGKTMFVAPDSSSNLHVYGLPLDTTSLPTVAQLGTFSQALSSGTSVDQVVCDSKSAQLSAQSSGTLFAVLDVAGSGGCGTTDTFFLVRYTDGSTTAPTQLTLPGISALWEVLYNGTTTALTDIVLLDNTNHQVVMYPYSSGTPLTGSPTALISNVATATELHDTVQQSVVFLDVTLTSAPTQHLVYRINPTSATLVYTAAAGDTFTTDSDPDDGTNLYFIDGGSTTQKIVQIGLNSGSAITLYTNNGTNMSLFVANGSHLLSALQSTTGGVTTWNFYPLVVGSANQSLPGSLSSLAGTNASLSSFTGEQTTGDATTKVALINLDASGTSPGTIQHFSVIINAAGSAVGASNQALANSHFLEGAEGLLGGSGVALQIQNITDPQVGYGGANANIFPVPLSTGIAGTALKLPGGATYVVPSGSLVGASSFAPKIGEIYSFGSSISSYAFDLTKGQIVPVTLSNSVISPL